MPPLHNGRGLDAALGSFVLGARSDRTIITDAKTGETFMFGETAESRTIFTAVSFACTIILSVTFGMFPRHEYYCIAKNSTRSISTEIDPLQGSAQER
jgi:hypothetical protein